MWRGAGDEITATTKPASRSFRQGILINALNPKSMLFAAAVLIVIFPANMTLVENALVVFNHLAIELLFYTLLAFGMNTEAVRAGYLKSKLYLDRTASIILGMLGLRLLLAR